MPIVDYKQAIIVADGNAGEPREIRHPNVHTEGVTGSIPVASTIPSSIHRMADPASGSIPLGDALSTFGNLPGSRHRVCSGGGGRVEQGLHKQAHLNRLGDQA